MTEEDFKKYKGKPISKILWLSESDCIGATVVGYSDKNQHALYAKVKNEYGNAKTGEEVFIPDEKESILYKNCFDGCGYSYLWVDKNDVKL